MELIGLESQSAQWGQKLLSRSMQGPKCIRANRAGPTCQSVHIVRYQKSLANVAMEPNWELAPGENSVSGFEKQKTGAKSLLF